jgi:hypothetical protein
LLTERMWNVSMQDGDDDSTSRIVVGTHTKLKFK